MHHFVDLFYPRLCIGCSRNLFVHEKDICWHCLHRLPRTQFHDMYDNPLERLFWGRIDIAAVTSFLYFTKSGLTQRMLHRLKYKGAQQVGQKLGHLLGEELKQSHRFEGLEAVVPVPLHPKKERLRGYNQSMTIARGLGEALHIPALSDALVRHDFTETQTKKGRLERWENVSEAFGCPHSQAINGKKILLVDDVLTTGATLEACGRVLQQAGAQVFMATLACALR
ncbi:MAG: ComF family protein [Bacteroidia bacterium]